MNHTHTHSLSHTYKYTHKLSPHSYIHTHTLLTHTHLIDFEEVPLGHRRLLLEGARTNLQYNVMDVMMRDGEWWEERWWCN